jgi:hypothetical protein
MVEWRGTSGAAAKAQGAATQNIAEIRNLAVLMKISCASSTSSSVHWRARARKRMRPSELVAFSIFTPVQSASVATPVPVSVRMPMAAVTVIGSTIGIRRAVVAPVIRRAYTEAKPRPI